MGCEELAKKAEKAHHLCKRAIFGAPFAEFRQQPLQSTIRKNVNHVARLDRVDEVLVVQDARDPIGHLLEYVKYFRIALPVTTKLPILIKYLYHTRRLTTANISTRLSRNECHTQVEKSPQRRRTGKAREGCVGAMAPGRLFCAGAMC